jgi:HK97 family phage prohead protease
MQDAPNREVRVSTAAFEIRAGVEKPAAESRTIRGYAAKFGTVSEPLMSRDSKYKFRETIAKGAFDGAALDDVRALFNHDANFVLARSKDGKGTLKLGVDSTGLWYEFEAPNTTVGNDLLELVRRGDIDQSSFAFRIAEGGAEWKETGTSSAADPVIYLRTITKISRVYDVSPVTEPAYADTSVAVRALETFRADPCADPAIAETAAWAKRFGI